MMETNLHCPQRFGAGLPENERESMEDYRMRRMASKQAMRASTAHYEAQHNKATPNARAQLRSTMRKNGLMGLRIRAYKALMDAWASKRVTKAPLRDEHGAYTLVGLNPYTPRRKWLAGISAQRGF